MVTVDFQAVEVEDEITHQQGYRISIWRAVVLFSLATLPCGLGLLLCYWFPHITLKLIASKCPMEHATHLMLKDCDGNWCVEKIQHYFTEPEYEDNDKDDKQLSSAEEEMVSILPTLRSQKVVYIEHRHLRYFYDKAGKLFVKLRGIHDDLSCLTIHELKHGLSVADAEKRKQYYGPNSIDVPVKPYHALFIEEVLHPFYIFQLLSVMFWMIDVYYYYAGTVLFISTLSVLISLYQTKKQMKQLHDMVYHCSQVNVLRGGKVIEGLSSEDLVPGDILVIPKNGMSVPCDAALLKGNCIVNEAMLTGESLPVTKTPLPQDDNMKYSPDECKRHTLYNGTEIIQTRAFGHSEVLAVVIHTGFATAKGSLVRSILFPKPLDSKMWKDIMKFVITLVVLAALGFAYTIVILRLHHYNNIEETILRAFDVITTVVPPALPAALTVGTVYSLNRLKKQDIYCISPQRVTLCGKIKLACFDKTGTLTEDSLDLLGVRPCYDQRFAPLVTEPHAILPMNELKYAMGTCHSLTRIDGVLSGDPLELKMFESLKWELEEPGEECSRFDSVVPVVIHAKSNDDIFPSLELGIMRQFTFLSELQRMSVLVRKSLCDDAKQTEVYVKGSPEKIHQLCIPESIPSDFFTVLSKYTKKGCRVLAVAHRSIQVKAHRIDKLKRDEVECDLTLLGLLIMQNKLKPETAPIIGILHSANIRTVMVTGDNLHTAISVARDCSMIEEGHRVIMLQATDNGDRGVSLDYTVVGEDVSCTDEVKVITDSYSSEFHSVNLKEEENDPLLTIASSHSFHLAIDGTSFALVMQHHPELADRLMVCGTVFARMAPEQKAELVRYLQTLGYGVAMCGDGANDCGALKAAHAGISLSETEASVASPFTSKIPNISCVPKVIKEGRAALVTAFSVFKFMALYSLTEFITVAILYSIDSNLGDFQYLYIDLVLILAFAFVMGFSGPYPILIKKRPLGTLAGPNVLLSLMVHLLLITGTQLALWYYLKTRQWYEPLQPNDSENIECTENTLLFQCSIFQYIILAVILSTGPPYRKPLYTNYWFMLCLLLLVPPCICIVMAPESWIIAIPNLLQIKQHPSVWFRATILVFVAFNFVLAYFLEVYIIQSSWMAQVLRWIRCKTQPKNKYKHVLKEVQEDSNWPPVFSKAIN